MIAYLLVYLAGGITFIPLVLILFTLGLFSLSPKVPSNTQNSLDNNSKLDNTQNAPLQEGQEHSSSTQSQSQAKTTESTPAEPEKDSDVPQLFRSGWLVVRRTYEPLPLNDSSYIGFLSSGYRSLVDSRSSSSSTTAGASSSLSSSPSASSKLPRAKDSFFVVLKRQVLFLYDNEEQKECWAAIELANLNVSIYPPAELDGQLFIKRSALALSSSSHSQPPSPSSSSSINNNNLSNNTETANTSTSAKVKDPSNSLLSQPPAPGITDSLDPSQDIPWFLFPPTNSEKEDWYHALLSASDISRPQQPNFSHENLFDSADMARLILNIDTQPDPIPVRWLNAFLGRIFLSVYRTNALKSYFISKMMRKLKRVKKPYFLSDIRVRDLDVGSVTPFFSKPMLKDLSPKGDASVEVDVSYSNGNVRLTLEAVVTINLGSRFRSYSVPVLLAVVLKNLQGTLMLKVKRPPSNRIWFGFTSMPDMQLNVEPVVSTRQIKWSMILKAIESQLRQIIAESIVLPHLDDIVFFDSTDATNPGGIWPEALRRTQSPEQDLMNNDIPTSSPPTPTPNPAATSASKPNNDQQPYNTTAATATATTTTTPSVDEDDDSKSTASSPLPLRNRTKRPRSQTSGTSSSVNGDLIDNKNLLNHVNKSKPPSISEESQLNQDRSSSASTTATSTSTTTITAFATSSSSSRTVKANHSNSSSSSSSRRRSSWIYGRSTTQDSKASPPRPKTTSSAVTFTNFNTNQSAPTSDAQQHDSTKDDEFKPSSELDDYLDDNYINNQRDPHHDGDSRKDESKEDEEEEAEGDDDEDEEGAPQSPTPPSTGPIAIARVREALEAAKLSSSSPRVSSDSSKHQSSTSLPTSINITTSNNNNININDTTDSSSESPSRRRSTVSGLGTIGDSILGDVEPSTTTLVTSSTFASSVSTNLDTLEEKENSSITSTDKESLSRPVTLNENNDENTVVKDGDNGKRIQSSTVNDDQESQQQSSTRNPEDENDQSNRQSVTMVSMLDTLRNKASDRQAIAAGVSQARATVKRWGANWTSFRQQQQQQQQQQKTEPSSSALPAQDSNENIVPTPSALKSEPSVSNPVISSSTDSDTYTIEQQQAQQQQQQQQHSQTDVTLANFLADHNKRKRPSSKTISSIATSNSGTSSVNGSKNTTTENELPPPRQQSMSQSQKQSQGPHKQQQNQNHQQQQQSPQPKQQPFGSVVVPENLPAPPPIAAHHPEPPENARERLERSKRPSSSKDNWHPHQHHVSPTTTVPPPMSSLRKTVSSSTSPSSPSQSRPTSGSHKSDISPNFPPQPTTSTSSASSSVAPTSPKSISSELSGSGSSVTAYKPQPRMAIPDLTDKQFALSSEDTQKHSNNDDASRQEQQPEKSETRPS